MDYEVIKNIVDVNIRQFIVEYEGISKYFDNNVRNRSIHPGEQGIYKEDTFKGLFAFALPYKYGLADGFVLNYKKEITTQCDLIIYDRENAPLLFKNRDNKFFPNEIVYAIGEVKSQLTISQLTKGLIKLAKQKSIRKINTSLKINGETKKYNPYGFNDNIFTFLICDEIKNYDPHKLRDEIIKAYLKENVELYHRHNIIISLANGLIAYQTNDFMKEVTKGTVFVPNPNFGDKELEFYFFEGSKEAIVKQFLIHLNNYLQNSSCWYPEPGVYIL